MTAASQDCWQERASEPRVDALQSVKGLATIRESHSDLIFIEDEYLLYVYCFNLKIPPMTAASQDCWQERASEPRVDASPNFHAGMRSCYYTGKPL
jgi:hypothetical protein